MTTQESSNPTPDADPIDQLVADYLETEAASSQTQALLDRVRATRHRQQHWREARLWLATAAMLVIGVGIGVILLPGKTPPPKSVPGTARLLEPIREQGRAMTDSMKALALLMPGVDDGSPIASTLPTASAISIPEFGQLRETLKQDASQVGGQLRASILLTLDNAGITL
jgi:hypothetical protein